MNEFVWVALCLFSAIGFVQCISWLLSARRLRRTGARGYHVVPLYDRPGAIEQTLRDALGSLQWNGGAPVVVLADMGLGAESLAVCDKFLRENPGLLLCRAGELGDVICDLEGPQAR